MKIMKKLGIILLSIFIVFGLTGCIEETSGTSSKGNKTVYSVDKSFQFDDLEITVSSDISFSVVDNQFDDDYNKDVIRIPITIKNIKDETHSLNMFYYKVFGPNGTEVSDKEVYFDDSIFSAGELRPGASYTTYLYYLYAGNGTYTIEFDDIFSKIDIDFEVSK